MFCNKCGAENKDGAVFCSKCGAQINMVQTNVQNTANPVSKADNSKEREPGYYYGLASFILPIAWYIMGMPFSKTDFSEGAGIAVSLLVFLGYGGSIVLGVIGLKKGCKKWMAITGIILGSFIILLILIALGHM